MSLPSQIAALIAALQPEDIEAMRPADRRQLADTLRHWADRAEAPRPTPRSAAPSLARRPRRGRSAPEDDEIYMALLDDGSQFAAGFAAVRKVLGVHRYVLVDMIEADDDAYSAGKSVEVALNDFRDHLTAIAVLADAAIARWYEFAPGGAGDPEEEAEPAQAAVAA